MKLNVATRLIILMNLPEQGTVIEMISKRNIRRKIDFSSEEMEKIHLKTVNNRISWDLNADTINVNFSDSELKFLKSIIDKIDKAGQITDNLLDFIEELNNLIKS